ncbi:MAG: hypothetical protein WCJ35_15435 [Planctomycetota bacterium]
MCQRHREIYQLVAELSTCGILGTPWLRLVVDEDCRRLPPHTTEMLARLRERFSEQDLLAAGVARREEGVELLLAETLATPGVEIILLRERPYDPPFDIVTSSGLLSGRDLPMFAACRDHRTVVALRELDGILLAVLSMSAYVLFRSMGLPVALATGLEDLDCGQLSSLVQMLSGNTSPCTGMERLAEPSDVAAHDTESIDPINQNTQVDIGTIQASSLLCSGVTEIESQFRTDGIQDGENHATEESVLPRAVILVAWEPVTLEIELPPEVAPIVRFLANAEQHMGIDLSDFGVWWPSENDLAAMQFCIRHGGNEQIRTSMHQSIKQSTFQVSHEIDRRIGPRPVAEDYATAQAELRRCLDARTNDAVSEDRLAHAVARHHSLVERDLVEPILDQATVIADPLLRNLCITAANVFRTIHHQAPYVDQRFTDQQAGHNDVPETQLNRINVVMKLVRELRRE